MAEWRLCSACKKPIQLGATYYACNVSTCNRKRTGMVFCTVTCWEVHLPVANHRESWAVEMQAPLSKETPSAVESSRATQKGGAKRETGVRRIVGGGSDASRPTLLHASRPTLSHASRPTPSHVSDHTPGEILIVASRLKEYIRKKSGYKTSERVLDPLSDIVRRVCDEAIRNAQQDGRMTVLDRDIPGD